MGIICLALYGIEVGSQRSNTSLAAKIADTFLASCILSLYTPLNALKPPSTGTTTPVTKLAGPPAESGPWEFWRGINVNGPPIEIDGHKWEGDAAPNFVCQDRPLDSPQVRLLPPTDPARATMIHSFRWNRRAKLELSSVPKGSYAVYAYVWEETRPTTFSIRLGEKLVQRDYHSGPPGRWRRLGPWITTVGNGKITITASGGDANFSGIEIWRRVENKLEK